MKRIFAAIEKNKEVMSKHKLFLDINTITKYSVEEKMAIWAPLFVHLTMTFRDVNQMFYYYPNAINKMQKAINAHAEVDSTHWHMLKTDLKTIGINENIKSYADAMDLIWLDKGIPIRNYMYHVIARAKMCGENEYLRITALEAGEATVKMFFYTTQYIAELYEKKTGKEFHYFGKPHINSEVDNAVDLGIFEDKTLDDATLQKALSLVDEHFKGFQQFLDYKYSITFD